MYLNNLLEVTKMKRILILICFLTLLTGCRNNNITSESTEGTNVPSSGINTQLKIEPPSVKPAATDSINEKSDISDDRQTETDIAYVGSIKAEPTSSLYSLKEISSLFSLSLADAKNVLGKETKIVETGAEGTFEGYYYKDKGITVVFDPDRINWVGVNDNVDINGAKQGMNFAQIQEKLGQKKVLETWYESPDNKAYEIIYEIGNCVVEFLSFEKDGRESSIWIYKKGRIIPVENDKSTLELNVLNEDFDVCYKGITLNDKTSLDDISTYLNINIPTEEDNDNIMIRAGGWNNDMDYNWYQVTYPNKEHQEIVFDYLYNVTNKSGRIVSIDLKNVPTKRGIAVGDTFEKIKQAYGNNIFSKLNTDTTNYIDIETNNYELSFIYEKSTGKITYIYIDYNSGKAMEEMDITGLGD